MTHITYRLTAKNRDQLRNPTLDNRVAYGLPFYQLVSKRSVDGQHQDVDRTPRGRVDQNKRGKEKVRSWCGQPSDRGRLKNRTELITEARSSSGVVTMRYILPDLCIIVCSQPRRYWNSHTIWEDHPAELTIPVPVTHPGTNRARRPITSLIRPMTLYHVLQQASHITAE